MSRVYELAGRRFGNLTVVARSGTDSHGEATWLCKCDCGERKIAKSYALRAGKTTHCGCLLGKKISEGLKKYQFCDTRLHQIWTNMKTRCNNPNYSLFHRYGGRGIKVCDLWANDYGAFQEWAFSNGYQPDLTLDRIDNDGDYCPENCRFATVTEQANNRSTSRLVTVFGETDTMANVARKYNMSYCALQGRLDKGWNPEDAVSLPVRRWP